MSFFFRSRFKELLRYLQRNVTAILHCPSEKIFTEEQLVELGKALQFGHDIEELRFLCNKQGNFGQYESFFPYIGKNLNKKFKRLNIWNWRLTSESVKLLFALETTKLLHVKLSDCIIDKEAIPGLMDFVKRKHPRLEVLALEECALEFDHINMIATEVARGLPLKKLDLDTCKVDDTGVSALAAAVKSKDSQLQELQLWSNPITQTGAEFLAAAIASGTSLKHLDLMMCPLSADGMKILIAAFYQNPSLISLRVTPPHPTQELIELSMIAFKISELREKIEAAIVRMQSNNPTLTFLAAETKQGANGVVRRFLEADGDRAILHRILQFSGFEPGFVELVQSHQDLQRDLRQRYPWILETPGSEAKPKSSRSPT